MLLYNTFIPPGQIIERFTILSDTILDFVLKETRPCIIFFGDNIIGSVLMALPDNTLKVWVDKKTGITIQGKTKQIAKKLMP